jgi:hypothetical protein
MRLVECLLLGIAGLALVGCTKTTPPAGSGEVPVEAGGRSPLTALDTEAGRLAIAGWKLTKVGQSHYLHYTSEGPFSKGWVLFELRGVKVRVDPNELTQADKLNGVEWSGTIWLQGDAVRRYRSKDGTWSKWKSPTESGPPDRKSPTESDSYEFMTSVRKTNGAWDLGLDPGRFKKVEPSDLPK